MNLAAEDIVHRDGSIPLISCSCPQCWLVIVRDAHKNKLPIFTLYKGATKSVLVRLWLNEDSTAGRWEYPGVDDAHRGLERLGLFWMPRQPDDEPYILGSWL